MALTGLFECRCELEAGMDGFPGVCKSGLQSRLRNTVSDELIYEMYVLIGATRVPVQVNPLRLHRS